MSDPAMTPQPLIALEHVGHEFDGGRIVALRDVNLDFGRGESVAIVGASGSGKTTLILVMCGIRTPTKGMLRWKGEPVTTLRQWTDLRRSAIGIVFQDFNLFPTLTARENVELPMAEAGMKAADRAQRARELLAYVGLAHRERHRPSQLSGGEQQRVAIARALSNNPALLLADEPTGELDARTGAEIISLFGKLNADGTTIVVVTHDEELASSAGRKIHMRDGVIVDP